MVEDLSCVGAGQGCHYILCIHYFVFVHVVVPAVYVAGVYLEQLWLHNETRLLVFTVVNDRDDFAGDRDQTHLFFSKVDSEIAFCVV